MSAYQRSKIYAAMGRKDEAFKWLNYEPHSGNAHGQPYFRFLNLSMMIPVGMNF